MLAAVGTLSTVAALALHTAVIGTAETLASIGIIWVGAALWSYAHQAPERV